MKEKKYTVRYFIPRVGADGTGGTLAAFLDKIDSLPDKIGYLKDSGTQPYQVRLFTKNPLGETSGTEYCGYIVRFRDERPVIADHRSPDETILDLDYGKEVVEINHFCLFCNSSVELLAFQVSMEGSTILDLARYFTSFSVNLGESITVSLDAVLKEEGIKQLEKGIIKSVEYAVARPRRKSYVPDANDSWTREAFEKMTESGASIYEVKISARARKNGLNSSIKDMISYLLSSAQTKKLRARVSECDHVIDLLTDRVIDFVKVPLIKGRPDKYHMFSEIKRAKMNNHDLEAYLVTGDEALDQT